MAALLDDIILSAVITEFCRQASLLIYKEFVKATKVAGLKKAIEEHKNGNYGAAISKTKKLAADNNEEAQFFLSQLYADERINTSIHQNFPDYKESVKWLRKAVRNGHVKAKFSLGNLYYEGKGVVLKDVKKAIRLWQEAAEEECADSQYLIGRLYFGGESGVLQNLTEAKYWWEKASEVEHVDSQFALGVLYHKLGDEERCAQKGAHWFHKAQDQYEKLVYNGHPNAQNNLGILYHEKKTKLDGLLEAYVWIKLANINGQLSSEMELKNIENGFDRASHDKALQKLKKTAKDYPSVSSIDL